MNQKTTSQLACTEEEKLRTLRCLKALKQGIKENAKIRKDMAWLRQKERDEKAKQDRAWEKRRLEKVNAGKKLNIVFLCSRPATWGSLNSICLSFIKDKRCDVKIVAIPEKEPQLHLNYNHNIYTDLGAFDFLKNNVSCRVINGYDPHTRTWFDLKKLNPDYIFFQTPYNAIRAREYNSTLVSQYTKICFITYGMPTFSGVIRNIADPPDFMKDVNFMFVQSQDHIDHLNRYYDAPYYCDKPKIILSGEPRFDITLEEMNTESPLWNYPRSSGKLRAIWTPRWTTIGNNTHFYDYKDKFFQLCEADKDLDFVCRPHPLTFAESISSGRMTREEVDAFKAEYDSRYNMTLDRRPNYNDTFFSSDVLVTDISSIIHDYAITGKPIIYCHKNDQFNDLSRKLSQGFYWAYSWDDVVSFLNMLKAGDDPLRAKRKEIITSIYYLPAGGAGAKIKDYITNNFFREETI